MKVFRKNVSLVLSGGGARGIAHIGVIEELERQGFKIHSISGTSMGALVGGVYALGKIPEFKNWLYGLDKLKVLSLFDFTLSMQGFVKGDKVLSTMKQFIPDANIEDLPIYYRAIATDIIHKKEVVFDKGSVYSAIRASMSIPTVFTPVKTKDGLLVDGGVINNIPLSHAQRKFGDYLIAVNLNADSPPLQKVEKTKKEDNIYFRKFNEWKSEWNKTSDSSSTWAKTINTAISTIENFFDENEDKNDESISKKNDFGYFDIVNQSIDLMSEQIGKMNLEKIPPDILIEISRDTAETFDFHKAKSLVEEGKRAAQKSLDAFFAQGIFSWLK